MTSLCSLNVMVILVIIDNLEYFHPFLLMTIPTVIRRKLLKVLPVADILLLESANVTQDINMDQVWKELVIERLQTLIDNSNATSKLRRRIEHYEGLWRDFYLNFVFEQGLDHQHEALIEHQLRKMGRPMRKPTIVKGYKPWLCDPIFGIKAGAISTASLSITTHHQLFYIGNSMLTADSIIIPYRYMIYYVNERKIQSFFHHLLSIFWIYGKFCPQRILLHRADISGLSAQVLKKYPNVLSIPLCNVSTVELVPRFSNQFEYDAIFSILSSLRCNKTEKMLKLIISSSYPGKLIRPDLFQSRYVSKLSIERGHPLSQDNIYLEQLLFHMSPHLQLLSLNQIPLSNNSNEAFISSIVGLFSRKKFKRLSVHDAELSSDVMNTMFERLLSSKHKQELELKSMRVLQFYDTSSILSISPSHALHSVKKSLIIDNMFECGFESTGMYILEALKALSLMKLTVTSDMVPMLNSFCEMLPVQELSLVLDSFVPLNKTDLIKQLVAKDGIKEVSFEIQFEEWISTIHSMNAKLARKTLENVISAMEVVAAKGTLRKVTFYTKHCVGSTFNLRNQSQPLPEGILSIILKKLFSLPNLHTLTMDISQLEIDMHTFLPLILKAWMDTGKGQKVAALVVPDENHETEIKLMSSMLKLNKK